MQTLHCRAFKASCTILVIVEDRARQGFGGPIHCQERNDHATADVANSKRHQRLDEVMIIFTHTIQEVSKFVCKKTMSETRSFIGKLMLYETHALKQAYAAKTGLR